MSHESCFKIILVFFYLIKLWSMQNLFLAPLSFESRQSQHSHLKKINFDSILGTNRILRSIFSLHSRVVEQTSTVQARWFDGSFSETAQRLSSPVMRSQKMPWNKNIIWQILKKCTNTSYVRLVFIILHYHSFSDTLQRLKALKDHSKYRTWLSEIVLTLYVFYRC